MNTVDFPDVTYVGPRPDDVELLQRLPAALAGLLRRHNGQSLVEFLAAVAQDPVDTLGLHLLMQYRRDGHALAPGELLNVYPPFCTQQAAGGVHLGAVPASERLDLLAQLAAQLPPDGETLRIRIE